MTGSVFALLFLTYGAVQQPQPDLPISELLVDHRIWTAENPRQSGHHVVRETMSWSLICEHDDLTGGTRGCYLRSPMYSEASATAEGFFGAYLVVGCDGSVKVDAWRDQVDAAGRPIPDTFQRLSPTRMILNNGPVLTPENPDRNILFRRVHAQWAKTTLAFEMRDHEGFDRRLALAVRSAREAGRRGVSARN